jgi:hypothetical protein
MTAWFTRLLLAVAVVAAPSTDHRTIGHVIERVSFGTRPGDAEYVRAVGIDRYIDEQLHPERLPDGASTRAWRV